MAEQAGEISVAKFLHRTGHIFVFQDFVTQSVDFFSLIVCHVIVFKQLLTNIEVAGFDLTLSSFNGAGNNTCFNGFTFRQTQLVHQSLHLFASEDSEQRIFHGQIEAGRTWVTLTAGTSAQLVVDTAGLVTLGTDNSQAAEFHNAVVVNLPLRFDFFFLSLLLFFRKGFIVVDLFKSLADAAA